MHKTTRGKRTLQLSYLAGFFDGEGSIFIAKIHNKRSGNIWYRLNISCGNSVKEPIEILHKLFSPKRKTAFYVPGKKKGYKPSYYWLSTGYVAENFLNEIFPYLIVKREQALLGIEFQEWRRSTGNPGKPRTKDVMDKCEEYRQKMKKLNLMYSQPQRLSEKTAKADAIV